MNLLALILLFAEVKFYQVHVTRTQPDVYAFKGKFGSTTTKGVVVTSRCYKSVHDEPAVIRYEKGSRDNKILFKDGSVCEAKSVTCECPEKNLCP
jgi:hypothetical protein